MTDEETILSSLGRPIPKRLVKPQRLLEDELVHAVAAEARELRRALAAFRARTLERIDAYRALLAQEYRTEVGGRRGGIRLESFDLRCRVEVSSANLMTFGEELKVAKKLVDECLAEWSEGGDERIRVIVMNAFDVGEDGAVKRDAILALRTLAIDDGKWLTAMAAINDALRVERSRQYVRIYERDAHEKPLMQICLDASRM